MTTVTIRVLLAMSDPSEPQADDSADLPPHLKRLKWLVTVLTLTMIAGVITISAVLVIRLSDTASPRLLLPETYALPQGVAALGYSLLGDDLLVVVGDDGVIRVFEADSGTLRQTLPITAE
jgi:hypothetical protein